MRSELKPYVLVAKTIGKLLHPFAEVVIHDIQKDKIETIINPLSKRDIGDSSYLEGIDFSKEHKKENIIGPYEKVNFDGRKLKSISLLIRGKNHKPVGFLCINLDISVFHSYQELLQDFLNIQSSKDSNKLFTYDLYEQINCFVKDFCKKNHLNISSLDRANKVIILSHLKEKGALKEKNAHQYIANILNISRASVYNYLKEVSSS